MTPEETANALIVLYLSVANISPEEAKKCALICINHMKSVSLPASDYGVSVDEPYTTEYLQQVKQEIEK